MVESGGNTGFTEVGTKYVGDVQQAVKYSSISSYMLKLTSLPILGFKDNNNAQENLSKHMCDFGARTKWWSGRLVASSYIDVDTIKYQYCLINSNPLYCITGYIMEDGAVDRYLQNLPHRRLDLFYGYISSY